MGSSLLLILQLLPVAVVGGVFVSTLRLERHTLGRPEVPAREQTLPPPGPSENPLSRPTGGDDPPVASA